MAFIQAHIFSSTLGRGASVNVIKPQKGQPKKILWLLHGASDDYSIWHRRTSIERYADDYGIAVVMPDVEISKYLNIAHGGRFYDYVAKELPGVMHSFFGFSLSREDNMICGLSMGGEGALKIGLANPEQYSVIGCLSAGMQNRPIPADTSAIDHDRDRYSYMIFDGMKMEGSVQDMEGSVRRIIAEKLPVPRVYHTIGSSDFLLEAAHRTRDLFRSFEGNPFDYSWTEDDGAHTWDYWDNHIQAFLAYAMR